jgi:hypothetical protein
MRRSAVRNLITVAGVPEKVAMSISGHKTRDVLDRYHVVSTTDVTAAMSRLELTGARISEKIAKDKASAARRLRVSNRK